METITIKDKDLVYREEGNEALIFDPGNGSIKILNPTATLIWRLVKKDPRRSVVIDELKKEYPHVAESSLEKDLTAFVETLQEMGLV